MDALACPKCNTPMVVLAFLTDPAVVLRILEHLGLPTDPIRLAPARCPFDEPARFPEPTPDDPFFDESASPTSPMAPRAPP